MPAEPKVQITLRVEPQLAKAVETRARREGVSTTAWIAAVLGKAVNR